MLTHEPLLLLHNPHHHPMAHTPRGGGWRGTSPNHMNSHRTVNSRPPLLRRYGEAIEENQ